MLGHPFYLLRWSFLQPLPRPLAAFAIEEAWARDFRRWYESVGRGLYRYLHDQFLDVLPILANGLPPDTGKPRHHIGVDNGEEWLGVTVDELKTFQNALGVKRSVAAVAPTAARFEELHASGLVDEDVIVDHVKEMVAPRTPRQLANAIAAAKELTEATLRAALDRLDQTYSHRDGLPMLMTRWRDAVRALAPPGPEGAPSLDAALAAIGDLVSFVARWRNEYGRGHGRPAYPPGLTARHARLASDAAETCVRFVLTTMDDLARLPPNG